MKIYLAGPLFTLAECNFNEQLACALENACTSSEVVLPQRRAKELMGAPDFFQKIFEYCLEEIKESDVVVAILDGADADSGTCIELGYANAHEKIIIGVRTDIRASEDRGLNLMVANICTELIFVPATMASIEDLAQKVANFLGYKQN
jgi:nucleoside 2-deoxyribosyltransferase